MTAYELLAKLQNRDYTALCKQLAEEGQLVVEEAYSTVASPGNSDWSTRVETGDNSASLIAEGDDVGFLEFGTGLQVQTDEFGKVVPFPVYPGSWSETHEKQFSSKGFWRFEDEGGNLSEKLTGTPASRGMQKALDRIIQSAERLKWNSEK